MADQLRVVRRRRGARPAERPSLTAAFQPVTDPSTALKASLGDKRLAWQEEAWGFYDQVGEFRYYVGWRAGSCSRVSLVASEVDPVSGLPTLGVGEGDRDAIRFGQIVAAVAGGSLGQSQLVRRLVEVLSVAGEVWLAILITEGGERWVAVTREEISKGAAGRVTITLPDGGRHEFNAAAGDGLVRIWNPHPRRAGDPDSPVRACLDPLREIVATTATISNAARSRLIGNGVLFIPQETSLPAGVPTPDGSGGVVAPAATQQLQDLLVGVASQAVEDPNSMAALVPIVASAPGEWIGKINHLRIDNSVTDVAIATRRDAVARLATGLDVSTERLTGGIGQSNHWTGWLLNDSDVQLHIAPVMETVCQAIYDGVLKPVLVREGIDPDRFMLWFDTSRLTADPDKTDEARAAFDAGTITSRALVRHYGLAEDDRYDFSTADGLREWAQDRVSRDPGLLPVLAPWLDPGIGAVIDAVEPDRRELPADSDGDADGGGPGSGAQRGQEPDTEDDALAAAGTPPDRVVAAVTGMWAVRALELAGKRRVNTRDRAQLERLRGIPAHRYHRVMGAVADTDVPKLIRGWDDTIDDEVLAGIGVDPERLRAQVFAQAVRELTSPIIDGQVV